MDPTLLKWESVYETGVSTVDFHNEILLAMLNELYCMSIDQIGLDSSIERSFAEFLTYAEKHFAAEESLMPPNMATRIQPQRQAHRNLTARLHRLCEERGERSVADMYPAIAEWLAEHIRLVDIPMTRTVRGSSADLDARDAQHHQ